MQVGVAGLVIAVAGLRMCTTEYSDASTVATRMGESARGAVVSADGTTIVFRRMGRGPAAILLHGGMMASQSLVKLGEALSDAFTITIPDRRGRGMSGAPDREHDLHDEEDDLLALVAATGARLIFGLSSGAIVALAAAPRLELDKLALYEPPFLVPGAPHIGWVPRYRREVAGGNLAAAMVSIVKGTADPSFLTRMPRPLLTLLFRAGLAGDARESARAADSRVSLRALVAAMRHDVMLVEASQRVLARAPDTRADVLLLGGEKSAAYLRRALDATAGALPRARRTTLSGVGHLPAENGGSPSLVAVELRAFFSSPVATRRASEPTGRVARPTGNQGGPD